MKNKNNLKNIMILVGVCLVVFCGTYFSLNKLGLLLSDSVITSQTVGELYVGKVKKISCAGVSKCSTNNSKIATCKLINSKGKKYCKITTNARGSFSLYQYKTNNYYVSKYNVYGTPQVTYNPYLPRQVGGTFDLGVMSQSKLVYSSSNKNVVSIDSNGTAKCLKAGTAKITAKSVKNTSKLFTQKNVNVSVNCVKKLTTSQKILNKAIEFAWPLGTPSSKYDGKTGSPIPAYKTAMLKHFNYEKEWKGRSDRPKHTKGISCSVFVSAVVRDTGYDKSWDTSVEGANDHAKKSSLWSNYKNKLSKVVPGDIFAYTNDGHILIYGGKINTKYLWYQANNGHNSSGDYGYAFLSSYSPSTYIKKKAKCNVWHAVK